MFGLPHSKREVKDVRSVHDRAKLSMTLAHLYKYVHKPLAKIIIGYAELSNFECLMDHIESANWLYTTVFVRMHWLTGKGFNYETTFTRWLLEEASMAGLRCVSPIDSIYNSPVLRVSTKRVEFYYDVRHEQNCTHTLDVHVHGDGKFSLSWFRAKVPEIIYSMSKRSPENEDLYNQLILDSDIKIPPDVQHLRKRREEERKLLINK